MFQSVTCGDFPFHDIRVPTERLLSSTLSVSACPQHITVRGKALKRDRTISAQIDGHSKAIVVPFCKGPFAADCWSARQCSDASCVWHNLPEVRRHLPVPTHLTKSLLTQDSAPLWRWSTQPSALYPTSTRRNESVTDRGKQTRLRRTSLNPHRDHICNTSGSSEEGSEKTSVRHGVFFSFCGPTGVRSYGWSLIETEPEARCSVWGNRARRPIAWRFACGPFPKTKTFVLSIIKHMLLQCILLIWMRHVAQF